MATTPVLNEDGLWETRVASTKSKPGHMYRMVLTPVSGWVHADSTCPARKECRHRREASEMTSLVVRQGGEEVSLAARHDTLLVEYDAAAISKGVATELAAKWAYDLGSSGRGVGVRGVEEGTRLLASQGEIIRVDECRLVHHDDREAFFEAAASRYVIGDNGVEIKLDTQRRGKRVSKWETHSDSYMQQHRGADREYLNPNWYELGLVKASRNAALALMPSNVKSAILKAGLDAIAEEKSGRPSSQRQQPARQQQPRRDDRVIDQSANHGAAQQDRDSQDSPPASDSAAAPPPDKMPGLIQTYRGLLLDAARSTGASDETIEAKSQELFNNKAPRDLAPKELQELVSRFGVSASLPGEAYRIEVAAPSS